MRRDAILVIVPVTGAGVVVAGLGAFLLVDIIGIVFSIVFWVCAVGTMCYLASLAAAKVSGKEGPYMIAVLLEPVAEVFGMIVVGLLCILGAGLATIGLFLAGLWLITNM